MAQTKKDERKADSLAKGGVSKTVKDDRVRKQDRLNEIMNEIDTGTARSRI